MLIRDGGDGRVVDAVQLKPVVSVAGAVVGTADDKHGRALFKKSKQRLQAGIHIAERGGMGF